MLHRNRPRKLHIPDPGTGAKTDNPRANQPSFRHGLMVKIPDVVKRNLVEFLRVEFGLQQDREKTKKATATKKHDLEDGEKMKAASPAK